MLALLNMFGMGRVLAWLGVSLTKKSVKVWFMRRWAVISGLASGTLYNLFPGLWEKAYEELNETLEAAANIAAGPAAKIASNMTGLPINAEDLASVVGDGLSEAERARIGAAFVGIFEDIFRPGPIAAGFRARDAGSAELDTFARFVGRNAQLQMAGIMTDLLKDTLPKNLIHGLGEMVDRAENIMGFEDSQEEIMEPLMEKLIITGLEARYNRIIKPTDLSPGDAVQAFIQQLITPAQYSLTLDNAGIMDDIRPVLLQLRAKNLSEADARDLFQWGVWDASALKPFFIKQGFLEEEALYKARLIAEDRKWKLKTELLNVRETQFASGVLDEGAFRAYLATMNFSNEEEDIEIEIAKGKASMRKGMTAKQITGTFNIAPWRIRPGQTTMLSWNIRNADRIVISGLGEVGPRGERVISPQISRSFYLDATSDTDSERFEAAVQVGDTRELKRPTASFSASPGRIQIGTPVELKWVTGNADTVSIDGQGVVGEAGALAVYPFISTIYTLRATNAQGTTVRQDIVFVSLPDIDLDKERRPAISFSISPGVVKPGQPQAELNWAITRADEGTLRHPDGREEKVSTNGAMIVTATASGIYTLKASNIFGETQNQEAIIFDGAEEELP